MKTSITKAHPLLPPATEYEIGKIYECGPAIVLCTYTGGGLKFPAEKQYGGGILLSYTGRFSGEGFRVGDIHHMGVITNSNLWNGAINISNG